MVLVELYVWVVGVLAVFNLGLCVYAWLNRQIPGAITCGLIGIAVAEVCLTFQLLTTAPTPELGFVYARLRFLGLAVVTPLMLIFVLQYTRLTHWLKPPLVIGIFIVPAITQAVLWFTPARDQFFGGWSLVAFGKYQLEVRELTGWYFVHAIYNGALLVIAFGVLAWYTRQADPARRRELYGLIALAVIGAFGASTSATLGPAPGLSFTPLALGVTALGINWLLLAGSPTRMMPVAYDVVFSTINDAVLILNPDNVVVQANPAAERVLKRPLRDLLNQPVDSVMSGAQGWKPHGADSTPFEITLNGGAPVACEVRHLPLMRGNAHIGGLVVIRDITAQQQALELTVERERSQIVSNFIANASHEFRTPLSVIKSSAYLLGRQANLEKGTRHIAKINDHVDRINSLVNDLQVMASLDSDRPLDRGPIDLRQLILDVIEGFARPLADQHHHTLETNIDNSLPILHGDGVELTMALQKVLDNAIQFTLENGTITVSARRSGAGALLTIQDTGIGMDEQTAQAALQRFYRLDTARSTSGFGLGLPIAQKIMQRHGGTLTLTSAPDAGTTVCLTLP